MGDCKDCQHLGYYHAVKNVTPWVLHNRATGCSYGCTLNNIERNHIVGDDIFIDTNLAAKQNKDGMCPYFEPKKTFWQKIVLFIRKLF